MIKHLAEFEVDKPCIYPMEGVEGSEIAIDLQNPDRETSILMVVESDGAGTLFSQVNKKETYKSFKDAERLTHYLKEIRKSSVKAEDTESY